MPLINKLACWMVGTEFGLTFCRRGKMKVLSLFSSGRLLTAFKIWLKPPMRMIKRMLSARVMSFHLKTSLSYNFSFFLRSSANSITDFLTDS